MNWLKVFILAALAGRAAEASSNGIAKIDFTGDTSLDPDTDLDPKLSQITKELSALPENIPTLFRDAKHSIPGRRVLQSSEIDAACEDIHKLYGDLDIECTVVQTDPTALAQLTYTNSNTKSFQVHGKGAKLHTSRHKKHTLKNKQPQQKTTLRGAIPKPTDTDITFETMKLEVKTDDGVITGEGIMAIENGGTVSATIWNRGNGEYNQTLIYHPTNLGPGFNTQIRISDNASKQLYEQDLEGHRGHKHDQTAGRRLTAKEIQEQMPATMQDVAAPAQKIQTMTLAYTRAACNALGGEANVMVDARKQIATLNQININSGMPEIQFAPNPNVVIVDANPGSDFNNALIYARANIDRGDSQFLSLIMGQNEVSGACGIGYQGGYSVPGSQAQARYGLVTVVSYACIADRNSLAHETGHNEGAEHNPESQSPVPLLTNNFAWMASDWSLGTVMAYSYARIWSYSHPGAIGDLGGIKAQGTDATNNVAAMRIWTDYIAKLFSITNPPAAAPTSQPSTATSTPTKTVTQQPSTVTNAPSHVPTKKLTKNPTGATKATQKPTIATNKPTPAATLTQVTQNPTTGRITLAPVQAPTTSPSATSQQGTGTNSALIGGLAGGAAAIVFAAAAAKYCKKCNRKNCACIKRNKNKKPKAKAATANTQLTAFSSYSGETTKPKDKKVSKDIKARAEKYLQNAKPSSTDKKHPGNI
jgi:gas vesicle protein